MSLLIFLAMLHCLRDTVSLGFDWLVLKIFCLLVALGDVDAVQSTDAADVRLFLCIHNFVVDLFHKQTEYFSWAKQLLPSL